MKTVQYRAEAGVLSESVGDRVMLIDSDSSELVTLNVTGSLVWKRLVQQGTTLPELIEAVAAEFPSALRDEIATDVEGFLRELVELGLVQPEV